MFIAFKLKQGRDDDLIEWITNAGDGDRSYHIREAIRRGLLASTSPTINPVIRIAPKEPAATAAADLDAALDDWL